MIQIAHDTAVVILSYNGKKWHELFLPLIISEAQGQYTVVVVDNASTDDTARYVASNFPSVKLISIEKNDGFARGYYEGLKQISAKYFVLLSADFEVTKGWYQPIYNFLESHPEVAACQPKIKYWRERNMFEYAGAAGGFKDNFGYMFCRGRILDMIEADHQQYNDNIEIFWASGGCLCIRSEAYNAVGGLDPDFYAHMEEIDLCWRLKNYGFQIAYVGDSEVYHVGGSVISYGSTQKLFYNFRNSLVILLKNESRNRILWLFPLRLFLDGLAGLHFIFKGEIKSCYTIIKAHFSFYSKFLFWYKKRKDVQKLVSQSQKNSNAIYPKSIIYQYFINKVKKFSDLNWHTNRY
jgi:GT2 family glycosyltransferase